MSLTSDIESKISIVELASRYLSLKKSGSNYKALCPFHHEKTPSFMISPAKNIAYCFSCHTGGGPVKFLMEIEKLEFREALQILAKEAGVELKTDVFKEKNSPTQELYDIHKIATDYYGNMLSSAQGEKARNYLEKRGITEEIQKQFQLGYCPGDRELFVKLQHAGFSKERILESGIYVSEGREKFYERLVFPISNFSGNPVGFTARTLENQEPKYLNSPATPIFNKSAILYGLSSAKQSINKNDKVIIVEGQMDTITLHQFGINYAVGISGTALTQDHIALLKRLTKNIYLCLDGDNAGIKATFSSLEALENQEVNVAIISLPDAKDPDEFLKQGGDWEMQEKQAKTPLSFTLQELSRQFDITSVTGKTSAAKFLMNMVSRIQNRIEADVYIREIAQLLGLTPEILYLEYKRPQQIRSIQKNEERKRDLCLDIVGYIVGYNKYTGFLENFPYPLEGWDEIPSFSLLREIIQNPNTWQDLPNADEFHSQALYIESQHEGVHADVINQAFISHVLALKKTCFKIKKQKLLDSIPHDSPDYLRVLQDCLQEERLLGLK